jgi:hypothetical protein
MQSQWAAVSKLRWVVNRGFIVIGVDVLSSPIITSESALATPVDDPVPAALAQTKIAGQQKTSGKVRNMNSRPPTRPVKVLRPVTLCCDSDKWTFCRAHPPCPPLCADSGEGYIVLHGRYARHRCTIGTAVWMHVLYLRFDKHGLALLTVDTIQVRLPSRWYRAANGRLDVVESGAYGSSQYTVISYDVMQTTSMVSKENHHNNPRDSVIIIVHITKLASLSRQYLAYTRGSR